MQVVLISQPRSPALPLIPRPRTRPPTNPVLTVCSALTVFWFRQHGRRCPQSRAGGHAPI